MSVFDRVADAAEELVVDLAGAVEDGAGDLLARVTAWVEEDVVSVREGLDASSLDIEIAGSDFVARWDGALLTVHEDADDDGVGDDLLFAGSVGVIPEGIQFSYDGDGDGLPDTEVLTVSPTSPLAGVIDQFI